MLILCCPYFYDFIYFQHQQPEYGSHTFHSTSTIKYTAEMSHSGSIIKCTAIQTHNGAIIYNNSRNLTLVITQPALLLSTKTTNFGILTGALLAVVMVIMIVIIILVFVFKKKKRVNSSNESVNKNQPETKDPNQPIIWTTKTSSQASSRSDLKLDGMYSTECLPNTPEDDEKYKCKVDIHNSSSSSSSTSSSRAPASSDTSFETNRSVGDILHGNLVSFSPTYMYTQTSSEPPLTPDDNPYKSYQPKRLGHFDPSTDVHTVTRPNTAGSLQNIQLNQNQPVHIDIPPPTHTFPVRPFRPLRIHPSDLDTLDPQDTEARLQSWDVASVGGASVISVFDCHHGCFSPDHSMPHCHQHQDNHSISHQNQQLDHHNHNQSDQNQQLDHHNHNLLDPTQEKSYQDHQYLEQSHCSPTGQRYTVRTRDTPF